MNTPTQKIGLLFAFLIGIGILSADYNYQALLATGDHGLGLYASAAILKGERPFIDFIWFYGPFMPIYYAAFFKIFGISILSFFLGHKFLLLLSGVIIYCILSSYFHIFLALAGSIWFWAYNPDFFYTHNHTGGVTLCLYAMYLVIKYAKTNKSAYLVIAMTVSFAIGLIKPNFGIVIAGAIAMCTLLIDQKYTTKKKSIRENSAIYLLSILVPLGIIAVYSILVSDLPFYAVKQNLQYFGNDVLTPENHPLYTVGKSIMQIVAMISFYVTTYWKFYIFFAIILLLMAHHMISKRRTPPSTSQTLQWQTLLCCIAVFGLATVHEYLISGVPYRMGWATPIFHILVFTTIGIFSANVNRLIQTLIFFACLLLPLSSIAEKSNEVFSLKTQDRYISHPRGKVFVRNPRPWVKIVQETVRQIDKNVGPDEQFLSIPYDPLYYFLTDKLSPTRQLCFFEFMNIPQEEELEIIHILERKKINWVVLSSRINSQEVGLGYFGYTHTRILKRYIYDNFEPIIQIGSWEGMEGFAWNHGTKLLKRKDR